MAEYIIYRFYVIDPKTQKELSYVGYQIMHSEGYTNPNHIAGPGGKKFLQAGTPLYGPVKSKMAQAINTYGWNSFRFQELARATTKKDAEDLKWKYIQQFNSMAEGLNMQRAGGNNPQEKKPVEQYAKDGKYIAEYESISEAARVTGIKISSILRALSGRYQTAGSYVWKLKKI